MWLVMDVLEIMFVLGIFGLIAGLMWFDGPRGVAECHQKPAHYPRSRSQGDGYLVQECTDSVHGTVDHSISSVLEIS